VAPFDDVRLPGSRDRIDGILAGHPDQAVERYRELGIIP
jgi:hypothetical protein